jgi:hypothetical protein
VDTDADLSADYGDYWVWDGQQLAFQFQDTDAAGPTSPTLLYRHFYGPEVDQILASEDSANLWYLADHLGTTRDAVLDNGNLTNHYRFDAYGRLHPRRAGGTAFNCQRKSA